MADVDGVDKTCFSGEEIEQLYIVGRNLGALAAALGAVRDLSEDGEIIKGYEEIVDMSRRLSNWQMKYHQKWSKLTNPDGL